MSNFFTPTFLKLFRRFVLMLLVGVIGALVVGHLHIQQEQAQTYHIEFEKQ